MALFTARQKIAKDNISQLEENVAQALFDLQNNAQNNELKAELPDLKFLSAEEIDVGSGKKAIIIKVPYRSLRAYHRIQPRLVRELEKRFSGNHVVFIAQRTILPKPSKNNHKKMQKRPRSRTLTAVHESILEDIVYPTEITGKRVRVRTDGSRFYKILLDRKDQNNQEYKLETFSAVYKKLTGKHAHFEFPVVQQN